MMTNAYTLTKFDLTYLGFPLNTTCFYQFSPELLTRYAVENREGLLTDQNILAVDTGEFTGRSPKDRFIVKDDVTAETVWWNDINIPFSPEAFERLQYQMITYLNARPFFVRDAAACADPDHQISLRVITETAYQSLFAYNLFISTEGNVGLQPDWTVIAAPGFCADPKEDQTRQHNFSIINFTRKVILIGGTGYTGEIKKGIFSVLNFLLPQKGVLPMHCAANTGTDGESAIFFGLSGTGKTTLSADPERRLIGDDEHGWSNNALFNFEGGCYAKTVNLNKDKEPQIYAALKRGALLENVSFYPGTQTVDFNNISKTENTRVSYPLNFIPGVAKPAVGPIPRHIFFLTADAFGVLPPISKLTTEQAMHYFIAGYTAKVAGTEHGINEPTATFSACFGKAFLPLHPFQYAGLLEERIKENNVQVWLINTGWTGGPYGIGERIKLHFTRSIISAAINGSLSGVKYDKLPLFELMMPQTCPGVPDALLNPIKTWPSVASYEAKARQLFELFKENMNQYKGIENQEIANKFASAAIHSID
ncbi:phosphoenolpyruvate carboxykinase (ATP) [Mucilaginibacter jinjuensis]|uniref:Phosphoenolpyruvate carboxykinase (ATP) n=1 Tax=Mucilaginibacter jinjuensis TaxID=1176721 RepID=A0ABY7TEN9_9SPHI|nr:phosphoenolpyruvate carboxykinase (ATP) [Mucilaginibacter jinjuensis]WCT14082.1 phosphoenolpyruvate carboxykinase (ATP) [Mucilaginibacter jinjuensis]